MSHTTYYMDRSDRPVHKLPANLKKKIIFILEFYEIFENFEFFFMKFYEILGKFVEILENVIGAALD